MQRLRIRFQSFDALNAHLEERCLARMDSVLRGHDETIGQRMERDQPCCPCPPCTFQDGDGGASGNSCRCCDFWENFSHQEVHHAVQDALRLGAISFDAVKHLLLCHLEGHRPGTWTSIPTCPGSA